MHPVSVDGRAGNGQVASGRSLLEVKISGSIFPIHLWLLRFDRGHTSGRRRGIFLIRECETLGLVGEFGSGKTTRTVSTHFAAPGPPAPGGQWCFPSQGEMVDITPYPRRGAEKPIAKSSGHFLPGSVRVARIHA